AHEVRLARNYFTFLVSEKTLCLCNAEVRQLHVALKRNHDVFKAYVAMDNAERLAVFVDFGMRVSESTGDATDDENREFLRKLAFFIDQLLAELFEIHTANQLHCDEINPIGFAQMV